MKIYEPHPLAKKFPLLKGDDFEELKESIRQNGQLEEGIVFEGKLLDGRNRQEACKQLGVAFKVISFDPKRGMSPARFVETVNVVRRHLNESQRGMIAASLLPFFAAEAKERQKAAAKDKRPKSASNNSFKEKATPKRAVQAAAKAAGASSRTVARAAFVKQADPALAKLVFEGDLTVRQAEKQIRRAEQVEQIKAYVPPAGKFQVVTTDFSWKYKDTLDGPGMDRGLPYPPMTVEEILAFIAGPLAGCCDVVCVLASWVTNPIMLDLDTWPVVQRAIEGLGFKPRKLRTWHKTENGHDFTGLGTGPRNDTEQLVIFTRGAVLFNETGADHDHPLQRTFFSADVGENSEKPAKAYEDLERMVPYTARLEMFARAPRKGWVTSGSELPAPDFTRCTNVDDGDRCELAEGHDGVHSAGSSRWSNAKASGDAAPAAGRPGGVQSEQPDAAMPGDSFSHLPGAASSKPKRASKLKNLFPPPLPDAAAEVKALIEGKSEPATTSAEEARLVGKRLVPHSFRGVTGGKCFDCDLEADHLLHRGHLTQAERDATPEFEPASRIEPPTLTELAEGVRPVAQTSDVPTPESLKPPDDSDIDF